MHNRKSFYKYVPAEVAKSILLNKTLRWSSPLLFDDRYDVTRELAADIKHSEIQLHVIDNLQQLVKHNKLPEGLNSRALIMFRLFKMAHINNALDEIVDELRRSNDIETHSPALSELKEIWQQWLPTYRILCLSASNNIPLMWSKYADNHKGVVLEFACLKEFDAPWLIAKPVLYEDRPSLLNGEGWGRLLTLEQDEAVKYLFNESCYTKTTDWAYQEEWRVVSFKRAYENTQDSYYRFYPQTLSAIYFGSEAVSVDKQNILSLLKYDLSHVNVYSGQLLRKGAIEFVPVI